MTKEKFEADVCDICGQATNYIIPIDKGTVTIVKALARFIRIKGINIVHPTKEMEVPAKEWTYTRAINEGVLTSTQIGNLTRARVHGLIARVDGEPGNWCFTRKGADFLKGKVVPRFAIIGKASVGHEEGSHKEEYWQPEKYTVVFNEFSAGDPPWEGFTFEIQEGRVVTELPTKVDKF